jgi:hypothetical protein
VSRSELFRLSAAGLGIWAGWNAVNAAGNYASAQALPEPTDWLAIIVPALAAIAAWLMSHIPAKPSSNPQHVLDALATLMSSQVGAELKSLATALKEKGFPPQGSLNVSFRDGTTQAVDWSVKKRPSKPV